MTSKDGASSTLPAIRSPSQDHDQSQARERSREVKEIQPITPSGPPPRTRVLPRIVATLPRDPSAQKQQGKTAQKQQEKTTQKQDMKALSLAELRVELTQRMNRLNSLQDYATSGAAQDLGYIRSAVRHWSGKASRADLAITLSSLHLPELFQRIWTLHFTADFLSESQSLLYSSLYDVLTSLGDLAGASAPLCEHAERSGVCRDALGHLGGDARLAPDQIGLKRVRQLVLGLLTLLYNVARLVPEAREPMREAGAVATLHGFRAVTEDEEVSCRALVVMAYIISEAENSEEISSDDRAFQFLIGILKTSLDRPDHWSRRHGLSSVEIIQALNRLAANDVNKELIVRLGALPCYVRLLQADCSVEEQAASAQGLWTLAFKCKDDIIKEPGCVEALQSLVHMSPDKEVKQHARGALWVLNDKHTKLPGGWRGKRATSATKETGELRASRASEQQSSLHAPGGIVDSLATHAPTEQTNSLVAPSETESGGARHVFISYNWGSQPLILKLRDRLKEAGYRVWVDVDNMAGSVLEAMAEAVENAAVVLIGMTQKYKESPNCRTEAEYTFRLQKDVVPLRLQAGYTPDGWLGALSGSKLVHDINQADLDASERQAFLDLVRDLGNRGKDTPSDVPDAVEKSSSKTQATPPAVGGGVASWTTDDVTNWLKTNQLLGFKDWFHDVTGAMLLEYKSMRKDAPETFHAMLVQNKFALADMLALNLALKQL